MKFFESIFESILWNARFIIVLAVVSTLIASIAVFILGTYKMTLTVESIATYITHSKSSVQAPQTHSMPTDGHGTNANPEPTANQAHDSAASLSIAEIVGVIDSYLLAIVLYIFSLGIYELFISKIDAIEADEDKEGRPNWLAIHDLDDLKEKLAKVIIMILMVTFYEKVVQIEWKEPLQMVMLAAAILLISLTFFFLGKHNEKPKKKSAPEGNNEH